MVPESSGSTSGMSATATFLTVVRRSRSAPTSRRLGISARRYFRTHDWIARYGDDGIAVLLPETTLDQAASLASGFCEMVQQRLVLVDHKTDTATPVSVSAAVVGADRVDVHIDASRILAEAAAAVTRAKMNGGNRIERVPLPPSRER